MLIRSHSGSKLLLELFLDSSVMKLQSTVAQSWQQDEADADDEDMAAMMEIAALESLDADRVLTNGLLQRCGDFVAPSGACGPLKVAIIPGQGRCFYDAVLRQLADCGDARLHAHADVLTLSMLQALSTCREQFEGAIAIDEASQEGQRDQRKMYVLQSDAYIPWMGRFTDFDYYVLDKAEAVLRAQAVLGIRQYVDTYEMRAWTQFVGDMSFTIVQPGQPHLGMVVDEIGGTHVLNADAELAARIADDGSLLLMHARCHYDAVNYADGSPW